MTAFTLAALLMIVSGSLHATVNAMIKSGEDQYLSSAMLAGASALIVLPMLVFVPLPHGAWHWLFLGTVIHVVYFILLSRTLDRGEFSSTYPVYRGTAPLFTAIIIILILDEPVLPLTLAGIVAIGSGILLMMAGKHLNRELLLLALATGLMTACYTIVDAAGVRAVGNPLSFILWLFLLFGTATFVLLPQFSQSRVGPALRRQWQSATIGGALSVCTFGLALFALSLGPTAELAALRETGMITATVISVLFLGERVTRGRIVAMAAILVGATLILV